MNEITMLQQHQHQQQPIQIQSRLRFLLLSKSLYIILFMSLVILYINDDKNNDLNIKDRFIKHISIIKLSIQRRIILIRRTQNTNNNQQQQSSSTFTTNNNNRRINSQRKLIETSLINNVTIIKKQRILYIITTLVEYNSGKRSTVSGSDRLQETTIPIITESVNSMLNSGYDVDVYMICNYTLIDKRLQLIKDSLPNLVNIYIWNDASPIGYDIGNKKIPKLIENKAIHLSRQHRFIIKDNLFNYDIFVNFEDDMYITGEHIEHYVSVSNEIENLYNNAPETISSSSSIINNNNDAMNQYYGTMTKGQLKRTIPGFMRVEVLVDEDNYGAQTNTGPIPIDLKFDNNDNNNNNNNQEIDSSICCHFKSLLSSSTKAINTNNNNINRPKLPTSDKLIIWETNIQPLGIRKMPNQSWLNWVVLQRGPNQNNLNINDIIGDYWINKNNKYYNKLQRPSPHEFKYINNQGGWMATRKQLINWHINICPGGFLPPYNSPHYNYDGLDMRNVEWYSGSMQLTTIRHACNMQRIIQINSVTNFSKSLLYHTANNKQKQLTYKKNEFFTKVNTLLGQLNTIKKIAEKEII